MTSGGSSTGPRVWRSLVFRRFWTAHTISLLGDQVTLIAIPLVAVTLLHANSAQMGLLTALGQAPLLILGLLAGVWVDRAERRRLLIGCDLGRALVIALVPAAALGGFLSLPLVMVVVFVSAAIGVLFGTAATAFLPEIVRRDQLIDANAKLTQPRAVAQVAGPGLGGALVQAVTAPVAILVDALSYLASGVLLSRIGRTSITETSVAKARRQIEGAEHTATFTAIRQGLSQVWRDLLLRTSAATAATYNLFNAAVLAVLMLHLSRSLHLTAVEIGIVLAAAGPGALLGAALAVPVSRQLGIGPAMIVGVVCAGAAILAIPLAAGPHTAVLATLLTAMFLNGLGQPLYNINQASLRQAIVPAALRGRIQATLAVMAGAAAPIGALGGGLIGQWLGTRTALLVAGTGTTAACTWLLCSPIRHLSTMPNEADVPSTDSPRRHKP